MYIVHPYYFTYLKICVCLYSYLLNDSILVLWNMFEMNYIVSIHKKVKATARAEGEAAPRFLFRCENHSQLFSHNLLLT